MSVFPESPKLGLPAYWEPFDVVLDLDKRIGWFPGYGVDIDENHPAVLTVSPLSYRLDFKKEYPDGESVFEWIILDRLQGTLDGMYLQKRHHPTELLKEGGKCAKIETKF
jgi:hypothetical protein